MWPVFFSIASDAKSPPAFARRALMSWVREQDLILRPSGYEADELPGCSIPRQPRLLDQGNGGFSLRKAERPSRLMARQPRPRMWPPAPEANKQSEWVLYPSASFNAWRRPTLPGLEPQYHRRRLVSRPSSGWDRVGHRRYGHQAMKLALWVLIDAVHL